LYQQGASGDNTLYTGATLLISPGIGANYVASEVLDTAPSGMTLQLNNGAVLTNTMGVVTFQGVRMGSRGGSAFSNIRWYGGIAIGRLLTGPESANCRTFFGAKAGLTL
jgi:hypothetical protein